jgi:tetratricopeptide (TPR) repeat protein
MTPWMMRAPSNVVRYLISVAFLPALLHAQESTAGGERVFRFDSLAALKAEFRESLKRNPGDAGAMYNLGRVALLEGKSGEAVELLERAVKLDGRQASYHLWLGNALGLEAQRASKVRQPFLARRIKSAFEKTVELDPANVAAREGLMQFYSIAPGVMGGSEAKAREQVTEIKRLNPMRGHFGEATLALRAKDTVSAERSLRAALAAAPDSASAYHALGSFYQRWGRWDDALAVYDRLLARKPGDLTAQYQIGRLGALSGQHLERAERAIRGWIATPPPDAPVSQRAGAHLRLGQIYQQMSRREEARREYQTALRIDPSHREAREALKAVQ